MTPTYAKFKNITKYSDTQVLSELENNLKYYLDWAFLTIGAWTDINIGTTSGYSGDSSKLRYVVDPNYTNGRVWQGFKKDWVYESGVNFPEGTGNYNPVQISGVQVNGVFQTGGYYIDYHNGSVVFDAPIATTSTVKLNYSYRDTQVIVADNASWWTELQSLTDAADLHFTQSTQTGDWSLGTHTRIQMPCIVVEATPRGRSYAYEMGNSSLWIEQDVVFHVLAQDRNTRNKLVSILEVQNDHNIWLFDSDIISSSGVAPLNYRGELVNQLNYPDIVSNELYQWKLCRFKNIEMFNVASVNPRLYEGAVKVTCELPFGSA
jgi:hypothetical protein